MKKTTWTRKEVTEIVGIPDRRLLFYSEQGILPDFFKDVGRGKAREYNYVDVFYLRIIKELDSLGLSLARIKIVILFISRLTHMLFNQSDRATERFTRQKFMITISPSDKESLPNQPPPLVDQPFELKIFMGSDAINAQLERLYDESSVIVINLNKIWKQLNL